MTAHDANDLEARAPTGDLDAQLLLADQHDQNGRHADARHWLTRAAQTGNIVAARKLGIHLLTQQPFDHAGGIGAIIRASNEDDPEAAHLVAVLAAVGAGIPQNWQNALSALARSASLGFQPAQSELQFLAQAGASHSSAVEKDWQPLKQAVDVARYLHVGATRTLSEQPRAFVYPAFASHAECDWLIAHSAPFLSRARIFESGSGAAVAARSRTNSATSFNIAQTDLVFELLRARIAAASGLPRQGFEHAQVLHYAPGEKFSHHFDFLDPLVPALAREVAANGQRVATFLIYLNEEYEAGETEFSELGLKFRGARGDGLLFWNVNSDGKVDRRTRHAGLAPISGEKWLFSQWIRQPGAV